jgi:hypothetical protein
MDTGNDDRQEPDGQQHAPGGEQVRGSWLTALATEAHHVGDTLLDAAALYGAGKVIGKIRKPAPPPPTAPGPGDAGGGEG